MYGDTINCAETALSCIRSVLYAIYLFYWTSVVMGFYLYRVGAVKLNKYMSFTTRLSTLKLAKVELYIL